MPFGVLYPQINPGVGPLTSSADPLGVRDSPAYYGSNTAMGIGSGGTVAANANAGNQTLTTALDAIYGPSNNLCPGIWIYLPATALAAPNNVAGWYWHVMTSTTVGTTYAITFSPGLAVLEGTAAMVGAAALQNNFPPGISVNQVAGSQAFISTATVPTTSATNPSGPPTNVLLVPVFPDAPPPALVVAANIATGSGSGWTGVTAETAASCFQLQGGTVGPTGSMVFEGVVSATNSAGTKTARGRLSTNINLTGGTTVNPVSQALTTGVSALITRTFVMYDGHPYGTPTGTTNSLKFVTAGSTPTFATLDESGGTAGSTPMYAGYTLQVGTATDWLILQGHYLTVNQT